MGAEHPPKANPEHVQTTDYYHHVRVRSSDAFAEFRTPLATDTESPLDGDGYDVRVGRVGPDRWLVESVLVPRAAVVDETGAERDARRLVAHFEDGRR
jgi:hypothetical protein